MNRPIRFGIVGGYGATGEAVASELWKSCDGEILIGGRDLEKAAALAAKFSSRVSAAALDVLNTKSLDDFCAHCSIIINCAGPVMALQDRVAQSAFRNRCHYVDVASLGFTRERLNSQSKDIADVKLSFVVSAGWIPGLSELLPVYAYTQAKDKMETIQSVTVYFGDSGEWSANAYRDMVWHVRRTGITAPSYLRNGQRVRAKIRKASPTVDLGAPLGSLRFSMYSLPELSATSRPFSDCDVFTYAYVPVRIAMAGMLVALVPMPEKLAVRVLQNALQRNAPPVGGFVVAQVAGQSEGRELRLTAQIVYEKHRDYWITGIVPATVARMIAEGRGIQAGVNFLADAAEPQVIIAELRKSGLQNTVTLAGLRISSLEH